jgi:hypothetical protein
MNTYERLIEKMTYLHDFFSAHPEMLPCASNRIGLTLDADGALNPLPLDNPSVMDSVVINEREVAALYTYLREYYTNGTTCMLKLSEGRSVKVSAEMIRHELATIQWLGTNVGSGFRQQMDANWGNHYIGSGCTPSSALDSSVH